MSCFSIIRILMLVIICLIVFITNIITVNKLSNKIDRLAILNSDQPEQIADQIEVGVPVDMGEFTMNLADTNARRYLKVSVTLEVSKTQEEKKNSEFKANEVEYTINQNKAAIKDAIISVLSSKTSAELATIPGKETAKEQIAEAVETIFNGEREVLRVSFSQFIMQ